MSQTRSKAFTVRPATLDDALDVVNLLNACAVERTGKPATSAQAVRGMMEMPGLDLETDTLLAHGRQGQLAGLALVQVNAPNPLAFALTEVHPRYWRTGIGATLCRWIEERARQSIPGLETGARVALLQQRLSTDVVGRELLLGEGHRIARHNFRMVIELEGPSSRPVITKEPGCTLSAGRRHLKRNCVPVSDRPVRGAGSRED